MGYFPVRYDSRVVIYKRKMFIRLATEFLKWAKRNLRSKLSKLYKSAFKVDSNSKPLDHEPPLNIF